MLYISFYQQCVIISVSSMQVQHLTFNILVYHAYHTSITCLLLSYYFTSVCVCGCVCGVRVAMTSHVLGGYCSPIPITLPAVDLEFPEGEHRCTPHEYLKKKNSLYFLFTAGFHFKVSVPYINVYEELQKR